MEDEFDSLEAENGWTALFQVNNFLMSCKKWICQYYFLMLLIIIFLLCIGIGTNTHTHTHIYIYTHTCFTVKSFCAERVTVIEKMMFLTEIRDKLIKVELVVFFLTYRDYITQPGVKLALRVRGKSLEICPGTGTEM